MELEIRATIYQPKIQNGQPTGLLEYVDQRTYGDLGKQFIEALKSIPMPAWDCDAYGAAEYISFGHYDQDKKQPLPKGRLVVMARNGNCEGYRVELYSVDENGVFTLLISAKYLSDRDGAWEVAKQIDEACDNGLYGY